MGGYDEELISVEIPATITLKITQKNTYTVQAFFDLAREKLTNRAIKRVSSTPYNLPPNLLIELE